MPYKSSYPYQGFPGLAYNELIAYASHGMRYQEKKDRLGKLFAFLKAFVVMREDKNNGQEIEENLKRISLDLISLRQVYNPKFEDMAIYTPDEIKFDILCQTILEMITETMSYAKMIERIKEPIETVPTGDE